MQILGIFWKQKYIFNNKLLKKAFNPKTWGF